MSVVLRNKPILLEITSSIVVLRLYLRLLLWTLKAGCYGDGVSSDITPRRSPLVGRLPINGLQALCHLSSCEYLSLLGTDLYLTLHLFLIESGKGLQFTFGSCFFLSRSKPTNFNLKSDFGPFLK